MLFKALDDLICIMYYGIATTIYYALRVFRGLRDLGLVSVI